MNHLTGMSLARHLLGQRKGPDAKPTANVMPCYRRVCKHAAFVARSLARSCGHAPTFSASSTRWM